MDFPPDLETARSQEADRRLKILGPLADAKSDACCLKPRARQTWVPLRLLSDWRERYLAKGIQGLLPEDWAAVSADDQSNIMERFGFLGDLADAETITWAAVQDQAEGKPYSKWTVRRWLTRYRRGGLWGLLHATDPQTHLSPRRDASRRLPEPGMLTEHDLKVMQDRRDVLGELAEKVHLTNKEVKDQADLKHVSEKTIWNYWGDLRAYGFLGLAPQPRSDQDRHYKISPKMIGIIVGIRLSNLDFPVRATWEEACKRARLLGEVEPSLWQVRSIIEGIPDAVKLLADRREKDFRNGSRLSHRIDWSGLPCTILIDHVHPLHILVKDLRRGPSRVSSGEVRPYMTLAFERGSRQAPAVRFSYDVPDKYQVGACIRDLLRPSPLKPFVVTPEEIWVDNGRDLVSSYVRQLTHGLGIHLHACYPHDPEARAEIERFFETLNTRCLAKLPGYVGSNPTERNPAAKAELILAQVAAEIEAFLLVYNHEQHSWTGQVPWAYWEEHFFEDPPDERLLDMLLMEPVTRVVAKADIQYEGRLYWAPEFAELVNEAVEVRAAPCYQAPDELEIYFEGRHICTALAIDSPVGKAVTPRQVAQAQHHQRAWAREHRQSARQALQAADSQLAAQGHTVSLLQAQTPPAATATPTTPKPAQPARPAQTSGAEERDMWDDLLEQERSKT